MFGQTKRMALRLAVGLLMLVMTAAAVAPAYASNKTVFQNEIVPFSLQVFNPCGAGGVGEYVDLSGEMHIVFFEITNGAGGTVYKSQVNPINVIGVGVDSNALYREVGKGSSISTVREVGQTSTNTTTRMLVAPGPGNNLVLQYVFHVTINANGVETAIVDHYVEECR